MLGKHRVESSLSLPGTDPPHCKHAMATMLGGGLAAKRWRCSRSIAGKQSMHIHIKLCTLVINRTQRKQTHNRKKNRKVHIRIRTSSQEQHATDTRPRFEEITGRTLYELTEVEDQEKIDTQPNAQTDNRAISYGTRTLNVQTMQTNTRSVASTFNLHQCPNSAGCQSEIGFVENVDDQD